MAGTSAGVTPAMQEASAMDPSRCQPCGKRGGLTVLPVPPMSGSRRRFPARGA